MAKSNKKFKVVEENAIDAPVKDIPWEGEELEAKSKTKIEDDGGYGQAIVLRFFDFGANPEIFRRHQPSAQELFNQHIRGIESLLWGDGLKPFIEVQPQLLFSVDGKKFESFNPKGKQYKFYRFTIACVPMQALIETPKTLSQLLAKPTK